MEWCCWSMEGGKGRLERAVLMAQWAKGVDGSPVSIGKTVVLIQRKGMNENPGAFGKFI